MDCRILALIAIVLAFSGFGFCSVTAAQATEFVANQSILGTGETAEYPPIKVSYSGSQYWIVSIISGETVAGFAALKFEKAEFSTAKATNEQLFKTASFAGSFQKSKSANQSLWFFTQQNADFFTTMSRLLNSEKESEIANIAASSGNAGIVAKANALSTALDSMVSLSGSISEKILSALQSEDSFFKAPEPQGANSLVADFEAVKDEIDLFEQKAIDYGSKVSEFRKAVSDANIDIQQKEYLSKLAEPPSVLSASIISGKKQSANSTLLAAKQALQNAVSNSGYFAESFAARLKRAAALNAVYANDDDFRQKTKYYSTLEAGVKDVLSASKVDLWRDQSEVKKLNGYWSSILAELKKPNYDAAVENAAKAKQSIVLILKSGIKSTEPVVEDADSTLLYELAIGAAAILALLYFIKKILPKLMKPKDGGSFEELQESYNLKR